VHLVAQPTFGPNAEAVANDQHADHQLRIDRWAARVAVERLKVDPQLSEVEEAIDATQQVIARDVIVGCPFIGAPRAAT
jgi:hypothetical protein